MEHKTIRPMTEIDDFATPSPLYALKCMIPYLPCNLQRSFAVYIKYAEFKNVFEGFRGFHSEHSRSDLIDLMKSSLDSETGAKLEQALSTVSMLELFRSADKSDMRAFFSDSEIKEFDTYSNLFNDIFSQYKTSGKGDYSNESMDQKSQT